MNTSEEIQREIKKLEQKLSEAKQQETLERIRKTPDLEIAVQLHTALCNQNHIDGCGWHYGIRNGVHNWSEDSHDHYLGKSRRLIAHCGSAEEALNAIKNFVFIKNN